MKQLNKMFMAASLMAATFLGTYAADVTFTITVDDPAAVTIALPDGNTEVSETNTITVPEWSYVTVSAVEGYGITSVVNKVGTPQSFWGNSWYLYVDSSMEGEEYAVTTYNLDESRTSTFTLGLDDPEKVMVMMGKENSQTYFPSGLVAGENTVKYNPELENFLSIMPAQYGGLIYKVEMDGEVVSPNTYGNYLFKITEGCNVNVTAIVPDIDINVKFEYAEGSEGCIDHIAVDGEEVSGFDGSTLSMKAGHKLTVYRNKDFDIKDYTVNNGDKQYWYGNYVDIPAAFLMADATLTFTAVPITPVNFTLTVDNPENVEFYNSTYPSGADYLLQVVAGTQQMTVPDNNAVISWKAVPNCYVEKVLLNGEEYKDLSYINLKEGDVVEVTTGQYSFDNQAVLWIAPSEYLEWDYSYYCDRNYNRVPVKEGYQEIGFYDELNPFVFTFSVNDKGGTLWKKLYCNNEIVEPTSWGGYEENLVDRAVYKFFTDQEPVVCGVMFNIVDNADFTAVHDLIVPVEDFGSEIECFAGTLFALTPGEGKELTVTVGDNAVPADEDGMVYFVVSDPATTVTVVSETVGIDSVTVGDRENAPVYNTLGVKVGVRSGLDRLPAGVYIVEGRKIVVR